MNTKLAVEINDRVIRPNRLKDWKFWYKLVGAIAIFAILFSSLIVDLVDLSILKNNVDQWLSNNPEIIKDQNFLTFFNEAFGSAKHKDWLIISALNPIPCRADYGGYIVAHFSYFTTLSNYAIGIWFLWALLRPLKEGKSGYISYRPTVIIATFITITMLIWLGLLMPTNLAGGGKMTALDWFFGLMQHAVLPLLFIGYVIGVLRIDSKIYDQKTYMKKEWKNTIFILLIYGFYCLIRGEIRYQGNQPNQYPYFFLNIHATKINGLPGVVWFFLAILIIASICTGFSSLYNGLLIRKNKGYLQK